MTQNNVGLVMLKSTYIFNRFGYLKADNVFDNVRSCETAQEQASVVVVILLHT